jgi:hypothetical protein
MEQCVCSSASSGHATSLCCKLLVQWKKARTLACGELRRRRPSRWECTRGLSTIWMDWGLSTELDGIIGFGRTVYSVEYTLTHSSYHFGAATAATDLTAGTYSILVNPYAKRDYNTVNGGDPFGPAFELWRERSPSFTVDRLRTPIRLEGHGGIGSVIGNWEWYAKLILLDRPVDFLYLPDGTRLLAKPWERLTSHQGNVDWFCFWLKNEEDPARWRELRKLQDKGEGSSTDH